MIHASVPKLPKARVLVSILTFASMLILASVTMSYGETIRPHSPSAPPAANNAPETAPGSTNGEATMPPKPGRGHSDEDYDSSSEPFGRGCPFRDNDLQLVS